MKIDYSLYTDIGSRETNEDSVSVAQREDEYCFCLCDGLGGHGKGELASGYVADFIKEYFEKSADTDSFFADVLDKAQDGLLERQRIMGAKFEMKTTAVILIIGKDEYRYAHIGDSRIYYFQKNKVVKRSLDHSVPQMLALAGDIKEKHIRRHADRNRLLRVMGVEWEGSRYEACEKSKLFVGDAFLLCSDGFWEPIVEKEMCRSLKKTSDSKQWLLEMAKKVKTNGKEDMDNNSAIAIRIMD